MVWIPVAAWVTAVVIALIVLGFAGYELWWKVARLRTDAGRLIALDVQLRQLQGELAAAQQRLSRAGVG